MSSQPDPELKQSSPSDAARLFPVSVAFVHNYLDEFGLDPYEFRLYAHVVRRTGGKPEGVCFASLTKIGKLCKMSPRKAQQAMKVLLKANLVTQSKRKGRTDEYHVTLSRDWIDSSELEKIRKEIAAVKTIQPVDMEISQGE
jgi:predicted metal-binding transcription factor (methanogenesis marker protein 9)